MLPVDVLNDLVRSYMSPTASVVPQFLQASFEMLRDGQSQMMDQMNAMNPMTKMPGFEVMQAQQKAFMKAMTGGLAGGAGWKAPDEGDDAATPQKGEDLDAIKQQLSDLQDKLSKLK